MTVTFISDAVWCQSSNSLSRIDDFTLMRVAESSIKNIDTKLTLNLSTRNWFPKTRTYRVAIGFGDIKVVHDSFIRRAVANFCGAGAIVPEQIKDQLSSRLARLNVRENKAVRKEYGIHHENVLSIKTALSAIKGAKPLFILDIDETIISFSMSCFPKDEESPSFQYQYVESLSVIRQVQGNFRLRFPHGRLILMTNVDRETTLSKLKKFKIDPRWFDGVNTIDEAKSEIEKRNKGLRLLAYMEQSDFHPDGIYFIDDSSTNCASVRTVASSASIPCHSFHMIASAVSKYRKLAYLADAQSEVEYFRTHKQAESECVTSIALQCMKQGQLRSWLN
ncbi:DUF2608 domain-containing protein [Parashewanella curva]|uniref:DUF2608 domain-containing protein n=1 Tax=Parashewanella curva TaxID=2338552 RepID=A0A3L8PUJ5_9GAMM|nr:DUF2608 domain-containing protein [Parashewanella curva]RLV58489.1 DUF2608 domain-containing protein [Parashewanella curva]